MKQFTMYMLVTGALFACGDKDNETAEPETEVDTGTDSDTDTDSSDSDSDDTEETDTNDDTDNDDTDDTDTDDTDTEDTNSDDPLANAVCDAAYAGCTQRDFDANDFRNSTDTVTINMVGLQPYNPKCLTVKVGQTVEIGATGGHPFQKDCAEDSVMDSQDGSTSQVSFTFTTPGYYNYRCAVTSHNSMVGNIRVLPE